MLPGQQWTSSETAKRKKLLLVLVSAIGGLLLVGSVTTAFLINRDPVASKQESEKEQTSALESTDKTDPPDNLDSTPSESTEAPLVDDVNGDESPNIPPVGDSPPPVDDSPPPVDDSPPTISDEPPEVDSESNASTPNNDSSSDPLANPSSSTSSSSNPENGSNQTTAPPIGNPLGDLPQTTNRTGTELPGDGASNPSLLETQDDAPSLGKLQELLEEAGTSVLEMTDVAAFNRETEMVGIPKYFVEPVEPSITNFDRQLNLKIAGIKYDDTSLLDIFRELQIVTGLTVAMDTQSWQANNVALDTVTSINLKDQSVQDVFSQSVQPFGLTAKFDPVSKLVLVQSATSDQKTEVEYLIPEAIPDEQVSTFVKNIQLLIAAESWLSEVAPSTIVVNNRKAIVNATAHVHFQLGRLLDKLEKVAAFNAAPTPANLEALQTIWDRAEKARGTNPELKVTVDLPLPVYLSQLQAKTGSVVLIDWINVVEEGWNPQALIPGNLIEGTTEDVLRELARAMELTFRAVDDRTFELTTFDAAVEKTEVEVYPCKDLLESGINSEQLRDFIFFKLLRGQVESMPASTRILFQDDLQCFIAVAPQSLQRQINSIIKRLRKRN